MDLEFYELIAAELSNYLKGKLKYYHIEYKAPYDDTLFGYIMDPSVKIYCKNRKLVDIHLNKNFVVVSKTFSNAAMRRAQAKHSTFTALKPINIIINYDDANMFEKILESVIIILDKSTRKPPLRKNNETVTNT